MPRDLSARCEIQSHKEFSVNQVNRMFAYSFDRETFFGSFDSRAAAFDAAVHRAADLNNQVDQVYIGLRVPGDPQASGYARDLIKTMRTRAAAARGEGEGDDA